jgi:DNA-binding MarR family transcriptional regulator
MTMQRDLEMGLSIGNLMHDVSRLSEIVVDRVLQRFGITSSQWWVLNRLSWSDGMTQTELVAALNVTRAAMSSMLDRLEAAMVIERRVDKNDARRRCIYLTGVDDQKLKVMRERIERTEAEILSHVLDDDLHCAVNTLSTYKSALLELVGTESEFGATAMSWCEGIVPIRRIQSGPPNQ